MSIVYFLRIGSNSSVDMYPQYHNVPNVVGMKDTGGDITQTAEFIRRTRDVGFKVLGYPVRRSVS